MVFFGEINVLQEILIHCAVSSNSMPYFCINWKKRRVFSVFDFLADSVPNNHLSKRICCEFVVNHHDYKEALIFSISYIFKWLILKSISDNEFHSRKFKSILFYVVCTYTTKPWKGILKLYSKKVKIKK